MFDDDLLINGAKKMEIELNNIQVEKFRTYYYALAESSRSINLTGITEVREIIIKHFLDSLTPVKVMDLNNGTHFCDIGTGAGFPGVPLKILYPDSKLTLIDSHKKKIHFLKRLVKRLDLREVSIYHGRAEELGKDKMHREKYGTVLSRAVAALPVLLEYALPFVSLGGNFMACKGPKVLQEIEEAQKALEVLGGRLRSINSLKLPFTQDERFIIVIEKEKITPLQYPRRAGIPLKRPLIH
ncbi:MAG: 16S rRNA (guanine(527)-N(7))-methyltransferase RsmG [Firmicutes bacterium HGW-Firmicutes-13]|nr:MAG: 16S rRNA (guanine(527)-N(7))-methyltransferase RsmG [Firmicutes bacterium HGW-Firmicutes-13]